MDLGTCVLPTSGWRFPFLDRSGTVNSKHERVVRSSNSWPATGKRCSTVKRGTMRSNSCLTSRFQSSQLRNALMPCYFMINLSNTNANPGMDFLWNCSSCIFCASSIELSGDTSSAKGTPPCSTLLGLPSYIWGRFSNRKWGYITQHRSGQWL